MSENVNLGEFNLITETNIVFISVSLRHNLNDHLKIWFKLILKIYFNIINLMLSNILKRYVTLRACRGHVDTDAGAAWASNQ